MAKPLFSNKVVFHPGALLFLCGLLFSGHVAVCVCRGGCGKSLGELRLTWEAAAREDTGGWYQAALGLLSHTLHV